MRTQTADHRAQAAARADVARPALLLTELFPPAVGGSAVLFDQIYSRLANPDVTVVTCERDEVTAPRSPRMRIVTAGRDRWAWGVLGRDAWRQHWRRARAVNAIARETGALVHCGRVLPEGLTALLAHRMGGPRFLCWTHGEELTYISQSRELTLLAHQVHRAAAVVIANSENTAALLGRFGVPATKIVVIHPGVDAARFADRVGGAAIRRRLAPGGDLVLLSVGRLQRRKGHDVAIAAIAALRDAVPRVRYIIAGDGEERPRLEAMVARFGLRDRVSFVGAVSDAELPAYYAACDLFLMPNRDDRGDIEGFGIVFLEAAAAGKPAIGGRSGGVPEAVVDGVTGLLVDGTDKAQVAGAIWRCAESPALRARLGEMARARVLGQFTWDASAAALDSIHDGMSAQLPRRRL